MSGFEVKNLIIGYISADHTVAHTMARIHPIRSKRSGRMTLPSLASDIIWQNLFWPFPMHAQLVYHHVGTRWVWQYFHLCLTMREAVMSTFCPPTAFKLAWIKYTGFWNSQWIWAIRTWILSEVDRPEINPFSSGLPLLVRILNSARESVVEHFTKQVWLNPISRWSPALIQFGWPCIWPYLIFLYHSYIMCTLFILVKFVKGCEIDAFITFICFCSFVLFCLFSQHSVLTTESMRRLMFFEHLTHLYNEDIRCPPSLLSTLYGLRLAEDLELGTT